ncbi:putative viral replication protein [compost metagenome]
MSQTNSISKMVVRIIKDSQSRKWLLTINNPLEKDLSHEKIKETMKNFKSCAYYCMSDEIGHEEKTHHTHLYMVASSAIRFSTVKNNFPTAHIDISRGTSQENRDYVYKEGKWATDEKADTKIKGTQYEWGKMPLERQGARNDLAYLYDMIKDGMSNYEIMEENPDYLLRLSDIERARTVIKQEEFKNSWRDVEVTYTFGKTALGKTRSIMEQHDYCNVYRVTDYSHPFDGYQSQDIVLFDEFNGQFKLQEMLNYLDGYPLELPCRYANKVACFTKVYIVSNTELLEQYKNAQAQANNVWEAFLRRIHKVIMYTDVGVYREFEMKEYLDKYQKR